MVVVTTLVALTGAAVGAAGSPAGAGTTDDRPNIIYILTDDLSEDLIEYMTELTRMRREGTTLSNYIFANSLCCPSRATILSGKFPHNNGVLTNTSQFDDGGFGDFLDDENSTFAVALQQAGYRTGMMGKYLNEYRPQGARPHFPYDYPALYVPPGWDEWHGNNGAYNQTTYFMTHSIDGVTSLAEFYDQYLTDVLSDKAAAFIDRAVTADGKPFFLKIAPSTPHSKVFRDPVMPYVPAPRDRANPETGFPGDCGPVDCRTVRAPRTPAFNEDTTDKPSWVRRAPLTTDEIAEIDHKYVLRVQMIQAVNDMIGRLRAKLVELGIADNTYLVFGSDNGFHLGEHRLPTGKQTAYEHDARVPLIVVGPGVVPGAQRAELAQNTDMFSTFLAMAGEPAGPNDGHNLLGLLHGADPSSWLRDAALIEHTSHATPAAGDPDADSVPANPIPGSYLAVRTSHELYVEYATGEVEYYDLRTDPYQLTNAAAGLSAQRRAQLHATLTALADCGAPNRPSCWAASQLR